MSQLKINSTNQRWYSLEDLPNEVWKDIKGYEGLYQISDYGRVKSLERVQSRRTRWGSIVNVLIESKILATAHNNKGYCTVSLCRNNTHKTTLTHRLVAIHFLENNNDYPEVDHNDENKNNNRVTNLVWCDRLYNNTRGVQSKEGRRKSSKFRMKPVSQFSLDGMLLNSFDGIRLAEEKTGVSNQNICKCCQHKASTAGGYIWRYKNE